jgi:3-phenylpropionate/trans-cinnamate dioxygenase ferredoxin subunit
VSDARTVRLCGAEDLAVGEARRFDLEGTPLCLVRCVDGYRAVDDTCSHEDFSLAEGEVDPEACEIECWKHGSLFSLVTGEPLTMPATVPVAVYDVVVEAGDVVVRLG